MERLEIESYNRLSEVCKEYRLGTLKENALTFSGISGFDIVLLSLQNLSIYIPKEINKIRIRISKGSYNSIISEGSGYIFIEKSLIKKYESKTQTYISKSKFHTVMFMKDLNCMKAILNI